MLLYTNTIQIRDSLTPDEFIALAIQWNQSSTKAENIIQGISWNGEHNVRFGTDDVWMDIVEYHDGEIIAVRYQKKDPDGAVWQSDFVMDFADWELTVRLSMETPPGIKERRRNIYFIPPFFPRLLMDRDYALEDGPLPVGYEPIVIRRENLSLLGDVITRQIEFRVPVVFISRTYMNELPIKASELAYQLKGAAHILVTESRDMDPDVMVACHGRNEYLGAVGVYLPDNDHFRFFHKEAECPDKKLYQQVFFSVIRYWKDQPLKPMRSWKAVRQALEKEQQAAEQVETTPVQTEPVTQEESTPMEEVQPQTREAQPETVAEQSAAPEPEKQPVKVRPRLSLRERIRSLIQGLRSEGADSAAQRGRP